MAVLGTGWIEILPVAGGFGPALSKEVGAAMKEVEGTLNANTGLFEKLSAAAPEILAVAGVAIAAYSVEAATKFQAATVAVETHAGITKKAADDIGNAFLATAFKSTFSAQSMMTAYAGVAGQWTALHGTALSTADTVTLMAAATDLAEASGGNLASTTLSLSQVMIAFKIKVADAADAADLLYNTSIATGIGVDTLAGIADKLHSKLGDLAPSLGDINTLLVELAQGGIYGGRGVLAVNSAIQTLAGGSAKTNAELQKLGLTVFDSSGHFIGLQKVIEALNPQFSKMTQEEQLSASTALFGKPAHAALTDIILKGIPAWDQAAAAVDKHGTAAEAARKMSQSFEGQLKTLGAGAADLAVVIGKVLLHALEDVTKPIIIALNWIIHSHEALVTLGTIIAVTVVPALLSMAAGFAMSAIGGFLDILVSLVPMTRALALGLEGDAVAATGLGGAFSASLGPMGLIAAGLVLLSGFMSNVSKDAKAAGEAFTSSFIQTAEKAADPIKVMSDRITELKRRQDQLTISQFESNSGLGHWIDSMVGSGKEFDKNKTQIAALEKEIARLNGTTAGAAAAAAGHSAAVVTDTGAIGDWSAEMLKAADAADKAAKAQISLVTGMSGFNDKMQTAANDLATFGVGLDQTTKGGRTTSDSLAAVATHILDVGKFMREAGIGGDQYKHTLEGLVSQFDATARGAGMTQTQIEDLNAKFGLSEIAGNSAAEVYKNVGQALDTVAKAQIALSTGMSGFSAKIATAANDLATYGNTLDLNTMAGQKNTDAIAGLATEVWNYSKTLIDAGKTGDEYNRLLADMVARIDGILRGAKVAEPAIAALNAQFGLSDIAAKSTSNSYTIVGHAAAAAAPQVWTLAQKVSQLTQLMAEGPGVQIKLLQSQIALADQQANLKAAFDRTALAIKDETLALDTQIGKQVQASNTAMSTADSYKALTDAFDKNTLAANAENDALNNLIGTPVAASDAAVRYVQQLDTLKTALGLVSGTAATATLTWDAQTAGLDITTAAGQNAVSAINQTIAAMTAQAQAMLKQGASTGDVNNMLGAHIGQLNSALAAGGLNADQIKALDASYGLLPDSINASVAATQASTVALDTSTVTGQAAVKAINNTIAAVVTQAKEMLANGAAIGTVNAFLQDHISTLDADLKKAGLSTAQIAALNQQYNLSVPALQALVRQQVAEQTSMDLNTASGRINQAMVLNLQQAILTLGSDTFAATGKMSDATHAMDVQKGKLNELFGQLGITTGGIRDLNTQYSLIPPTKTTTVTADPQIDITKATADLTALQTLFAASPLAVGVIPIGANTIATAGLPAHAAGGITRGPAIAGEGNAPEVVVPLDPTYHANAVSLTKFAAQALGLPMLAAGGIANMPTDWSSFAGDVGSAVVTKEHDIAALMINNADVKALAAITAAQTAAAATTAGGGGGLTWPFPTQSPSQFNRIDQGWDLQEGPGGVVLSVAAGRIGLAGADPGGFGNDYPFEILDAVGPGFMSDTIYYGHVHALASVIGKHVADAVPIAVTNSVFGQNGSGAPPGWLEIGWAQTGSGAPLTRGGGATSGGQSIHDILLAPPTSRPIAAPGVPGVAGAINGIVDFAVALEKALGDPVTNSSNAAILKWASRESGSAFPGSGPDAPGRTHNPLNTTQSWPGATSMNSVGVKVYQSWADGIAATAKTINNGYYPHIAADLRAGTGFGHEVNPDLTTWGTGPIFDNGGWLMPTPAGTVGTYQNLTGQPERVLPPGGGGRGNVVIEKGAVQLTFTGPVNPDTAGQLKGQIEGGIVHALESILDRVQAARPGGF